MLTHILTGAPERKKYPTFYTGSDRAKMRHANMICDATDAKE